MGRCFTSKHLRPPVSYSFYFALFCGHTQSAQWLLLLAAHSRIIPGLEGPCGMLRIEPGLTTCKANALYYFSSPSNYFVYLLSCLLVAVVMIGILGSYTHLWSLHTNLLASHCFNCGAYTHLEHRPFRASLWYLHKCSPGFVLLLC